jgi:hippurate hydrolase
MRQICAGIATTHAVEITMEFTTEFIETINAPAPCEAVYQAAEQSGLEVHRDRPPMSFSEDFAHFASMIPACFLLLGNGTTGAHGQPLHASDYDFNDALLPIGARFWANLVRARLTQER